MGINSLRIHISFVIKEKERFTETKKANTMYVADHSSVEHFIG